MMSENHYFDEKENVSQRCALSYHVPGLSGVGARDDTIARDKDLRRTCSAGGEMMHDERRVCPQESLNLSQNFSEL
jgi:hypothetical protein